MNYEKYDFHSYERGWPCFSNCFDILRCNIHLPHQERNAPSASVKRRLSFEPAPAQRFTPNFYSFPIHAGGF
jgi:hypothetical protein